MSRDAYTTSGRILDAAGAGGTVPGFENVGSLLLDLGRTTPIPAGAAMRSGAVAAAVAATTPGMAARLALWWKVFVLAVPVAGVAALLAFGPAGAGSSPTDVRAPSESPGGDGGSGIERSVAFTDDEPDAPDSGGTTPDTGEEPASAGRAPDPAAAPAPDGPTSTPAPTDAPPGTEHVTTTGPPPETTVSTTTSPSATSPPATSPPTTSTTTSAPPTTSTPPTTTTEDPGESHGNNGNGNGNGQGNGKGNQSGNGNGNGNGP